MYLRLPHATSGSCLLWSDNHSVVYPMGYGIYSLERSIAGRNDKQFPGRSHSSVNVYLFWSYQPGNSMWHLYRRSGMHTPFHFGHRLCGSRTGLVDFCLLEQDCQKENERNVCFSLMHDWACSLLSGPVSKLCSVWKRCDKTDLLAIKRYYTDVYGRLHFMCGRIFVSNYRSRSYHEPAYGE